MSDPKVAYSWLPQQSSGLADSLASVSHFMMEASQADKLIRSGRAEKEKIVSDSFKMADLMSADVNISKQIAAKYGIKEDDPEFTIKVNNELRKRFNYDPNMDSETAETVSGKIVNGLQSIAQDIDDPRVIEAIAFNMDKAMPDTPVNSKLWFDELSDMKGKEKDDQLYAENHASALAMEETFVKNGRKVDHSNKAYIARQSLDAATSVADFSSKNQKSLVQLSVPQAVKLYVDSKGGADKVNQQELAYVTDYLGFQKQDYQWKQQIANAASAAQADMVRANAAAWESKARVKLAQDAQASQSEMDKLDVEIKRQTLIGKTFENDKARAESMGIINSSDAVKDYLDPIKKQMVDISSKSNFKTSKELQTTYDQLSAASKAVGSAIRIADSENGGVLNAHLLSSLSSGVNPTTGYNTVTSALEDGASLGSAYNIMKKTNPNVNAIAKGDDYIVVKDENGQGIKLSESYPYVAPYDLPEVTVNAPSTNFTGKKPLSSFINK
jgi:hypothetical protein